MAEPFDVQAMSVLRQMGLPQAANWLGRTSATNTPGPVLGGEGGFKLSDEPSPYDQTPEQRSRKAAEIAMSLGPGILAGAKGAEATGGEVLRQFREGARAAQSGVGPQRLWSEFGYGVGPEGGGRWEIPRGLDKAAIQALVSQMEKDPHLGISKYERPMSELATPEFQQAYPELVKQYRVIGEGGSHQYLMYPNRSVNFGVKSPEARRTDLGWWDRNLPHEQLEHEVQHAVQFPEGFPQGAPVGGQVGFGIDPTLANKYPHSVLAAVEKLRAAGWPGRRIDEEFIRYLRHSGEVEARNVTDRLANPFLRDLPPSMTEDIPREWQILDSNTTRRPSTDWSRIKDLPQSGPLQETGRDLLHTEGNPTRLEDLASAVRVLKSGNKPEYYQKEWKPDPDQLKQIRRVQKWLELIKPKGGK